MTKSLEELGTGKLLEWERKCYYSLHLVKLLHSWAVISRTQLDTTRDRAITYLLPFVTMQCGKNEYQTGKA